MPVLNDLIEDHNLILQAMERLEALGRGALLGETLDEAELELLRSFLNEFVLDLHHAKEHLLFAGLEGQGFRSKGGALGMLTYEHEAFREALGRVDRATEPAKIGDRWALATWARQVDALVNLVRAHMAKETEVFFPMARNRASAEVLEAIAAQVRDLVAERYAGERERWIAALADPSTPTNGREAQ